MAEQAIVSIKREKINKANTNMIAIVAVASFITVFSLVTIKDLVSQYAYQSRVASQQQVTVNQLQDDQSAANQLVSSFDTFDSKDPNIIGGSATLGTANNTGDNAKIVLDALPEVYDFPAFISGIQNFLITQGVTVESLGATEASPTASAAPVSGTAPTPVGIPFEFNVEGPNTNVQTLISNLQKSIRPIQIQSIQISAQQGNNISAQITADSYYQPASGLIIGQETVK